MFIFDHYVFHSLDFNITFPSFIHELQQVKYIISLQLLFIF